jgi:hypothetical protein
MPAYLTVTAQLILHVVFGLGRDERISVNNCVVED